MASLFKRAAARGVAYELVRQGAVAFPTKQAMDEAADAVADAMPEDMPEVSGDEGHDSDDVAAIANKLIEIARALMASEGADPAQAEELGKAASECDFESTAADEAVALMDKAAAEAQGALVQGGDKGNSLAQATETNELAALDNKRRPEGRYVVGQGNTALDTSSGEQGHQGAPTVSPSNSPSGTNSINEDAKKAALNDALAKVANKLVGLHSDKGNTMQQAAQVDSVAALDLKNRPEGKYVVEQGGANFSETQAARIGLEKKPTAAPSNSPCGSNSITQASKTSEEDAALLVLFKKTASEVGARLPAGLSDDEKVASIQAMIGLNAAGRETYLEALNAKVAAEVAQQKQGSLLEQIRAIASASTKA